MLIAIIILCIAIVLLVVALFLSVRTNLVLNDKLEIVQDQVEECIVVLGRCHDKFAYFAKQPVLSDEPIIKQLMTEIRRGQHAFHQVAYKIESAAVDFEEKKEDTDE